MGQINVQNSSKETGFSDFVLVLHSNDIASKD